MSDEREPQSLLQPEADQILQRDKLSKEIGKLEQEIARLRSENTSWGTASRNTWPLISGLVSVLVSAATVSISGYAIHISRQSQQFTVDQEKEKRFFPALQMATDEKGGQDARTAGIWTLSDHWHDQYSSTVASTLGAILATEPLDNTASALAKTQMLRYSAAIVIGTAFQSGDADEQTRLTKLLYGDAPNSTSGAVTREQQYWSNAKAVLVSDPTKAVAAELILQVTREAIRYNSQHLESGMFGSDNLSGIELHDAKAHGAYFGNATLIGANLCYADLSEATFDNADLSFADLHGADVFKTYGWNKQKNTLNGANIRGVKHPTREFLELAKRTGAVDLSLSDWLTESERMGHPQPKSTSLKNCDKDESSTPR